jgi:hypothetical protein
MPYHWGNPWFSVKIQHLEETKSKNNVFFFGSSRVYRQINPHVFDSVVNGNTQFQIKSFNCGASATFNPQSYYLYENFLNSEISKNVKYCIFELTDISLLGDPIMHQERTSYYQNFSDLLFVCKSFYQNNSIKNEVKYKSVKNYGISYIEKLFHLGHFRNQIVNKDFYNKRYLGPYENGFFPLEKDLLSTEDTVVKNNLLMRKQKIVDNPYIIEKRKEKMIEAYNNPSKDYDQINLHRVLKLIQMSNEQGIQLIFLMSPRNSSPGLVNLSRKIPEKNFIDMCNPKFNSDFYNYEYSFDVGHLNLEGANLYTKMLALEFVKNQY